MNCDILYSLETKKCMSCDTTEEFDEDKHQCVSLGGGVIVGPESCFGDTPYFYQKQCLSCGSGWFSDGSCKCK